MDKKKTKKGEEKSSIEFSEVQEVLTTSDDLENIRKKIIKQSKGK